MLKFYNSLGRKLQEFKPITAGEVKMYTCGPTVWNYPHIGNYRTFLFEDVLRRFLKFKGFKVTQVMNITDVEDRIIRAVKSTGKPLSELTKFYEAAFYQDLARLGIERAEFYPRPTDHIEDIEKLIEVLVEKGFAYKASDGSVYYAVSKFKRYGDLSGVKLDANRPAGRVAVDYYEEKREASDFALWKAWDPEDGDVFWTTKLGKGRPGWHIECSAMSMKYLGETFDIHTGGKDHLFPHHENEIAQSEAATGKKFVNYWLHSDFLNMEGKEMHKSVGNVVYLGGLIDRGWEPLTIRLFLVSARYRDPVDLTDAGLAQARAQRLRLQELISRLNSVDWESNPGAERGPSLLESFESAMDDDLNTTSALAALFVYAKRTNALIDSKAIGKEEAARALADLAKVNSVLGVLEFEEDALPPDLSKLLADREEARKRKDFAESDRLRRQLLEAGIVVEDTKSGQRWKRQTQG
jgi:cysteinyl-tRNA synthetase